MGFDVGALILPLPHPDLVFTVLKLAFSKFYASS